MMTAPATDKQLAFLHSLAREVGFEPVPDIAISRDAASARITELLALRAHKMAVKPVVALEEGVYARDGEIFKVQKGKQSGNLYAKRLAPFGGKRLVDATEDTVHFEFVYEPGAVRNLSADNKLSLDAAKAFGLRYGVCAVCGARLSDADSVKAGIGPVCVLKWQ